MNKRDKEVIAYQLEDEKKVLRELKRQYERSLITIESKIKLLQSGEMTQSKIYQINYQKALKAQVDAILDKLQADEYDTIQQYLDRSYTDGYVGAMYQIGGSGVNVIVPIDQDAAAKAIITDSKLSVNLYASLGYDMDKLKKSVRDEITRGISSSLSYEEIARNLSEYSTVALSNANRIVRTEAHRIQQASADDARLAAKAKGADVVKQWDASLDGATRPLHRELDGQIREVDEPFDAGGKKVMYPGKFGTPDQDCNCRCVALTRARWALDEKELETLKERAKFFGLDKTESFVDYKRKYLKAADYLNVEQSRKITKKPGKKNAYSVNSGLVNSKEYHDKFDGLTRGKPVNEAIYKEAARMLEHRDGTDLEDMVLIDTRTGKFVTGNLKSTKPGATGLTAEQYNAYANHKGSVAIVHNHPNGSRPSYTDILTMYKQDKVEAVVAVGHDGTVHIVSSLNRDFDIENYWQEAYNDAVEQYGDKEVAKIKATDALYNLGVFKYERR